MKKLIQLIAIVLLSISSINAQNPFEKLGYTPKIATLSQGKYNEFFDQNSIVQIGTILFNVNTQQIVGFVETDTLYSEATLEPELVSRWMSPDPLESEYTSLSPYNFVANTPIQAFDPDGRKIFIYYKTTEKDKNGKEIIVSKYFEYKSGLKAPNNEFVQNTILSLEHLCSSIEGEFLVDKISNSITKSIDIKEVTTSSEFLFDPTVEFILDKLPERGVNVNIKSDVVVNHGVLFFSPYIGLEFKDATGKDVSISPSTAFGHELGHAWAALFTTTAFFARAETVDKKFNNKEEKFATENFENKIASKFNEGIRVDRSGKGFRAKSPTSNKKATPRKEAIKMEKESLKPLKKSN